MAAGKNFFAVDHSSSTSIFTPSTFHVFTANFSLDIHTKYQLGKLDFFSLPATQAVCRWICIPGKWHRQNQWWRRSLEGGGGGDLPPRKFAEQIRRHPNSKRNQKCSEISSLNGFSCRFRELKIQSAFRRWYTEWLCLPAFYRPWGITTSNWTFSIRNFSRIASHSSSNE